MWAPPLETLTQTQQMKTWWWLSWIGLVWTEEEEWASWSGQVDPASSTACFSSLPIHSPLSRHWLLMQQPRWKNSKSELTSEMVTKRINCTHHPSGNRPGHSWPSSLLLGGHIPLRRRLLCCRFLW